MKLELKLKCGPINAHKPDSSKTESRGFKSRFVWNFFLAIWKFIVFSWQYLIFHISTCVFLLENLLLGTCAGIFPHYFLKIPNMFRYIIFMYKLNLIACLSIFECITIMNFCFFQVVATDSVTFINAKCKHFTINTEKYKYAYSLGHANFIQDLDRMVISNASLEQTLYSPKFRSFKIDWIKS